MVNEDHSHCTPPYARAQNLCATRLLHFETTRNLKILISSFCAHESEHYEGFKVLSEVFVLCLLYPLSISNSLRGKTSVGLPWTPTRR